MHESHVLPQGISLNHKLGWQQLYEYFINSTEGMLNIFFYCHDTFPLQHIHIEISVYGVCPFTAIVLRRQNLLAAPAILYEKPRGRRTSQKEKTFCIFSKCTIPKIQMLSRTWSTKLTYRKKRDCYATQCKIDTDTVTGSRFCTIIPGVVPSSGGIEQPWWSSCSLYYKTIL